MAKTVVGLFDSMSEAEHVVQELVDNGFARDAISLVAQGATGARAVGAERAEDDAGGAAAGLGVGAATGGVLGLLVGLGALAIPGIGPIIAAGPLAAAIGTAAGAATGAAVGAAGGAVVGGLLGALLDAGVPEEEAHIYTEGVRRGGTLVMVSASDAMADSARSIMSRHGAVDIDERGASWRQSGWERFDPESEPYRTDDEGNKLGQKWEESSKVGTVGGTVAGAATGAAAGSVAGPVGTVAGGIAGAAVGAGLGAAGDAAGEGIEDETFSPDTPGERARAARRGFDTYDEDFRGHYTTYATNSGYSYEQYAPVYRYGYNLAYDPAFSGREWNDVEFEARRRWEERNPNTWDQFKDSVRYAWDKVRGER